MPSLLTLPREVFLEICDVLSDSDFLRLQEVSSKLREFIFASSRTRKIHSRKHVFLCEPGLKRFVALATEFRAVEFVTHLRLDLSSPRFTFNRVAYEEDNGRCYMHGSRIERWSYFYPNENIAACCGEAVPEELLNYAPVFESPQSEYPSLVEAFRCIPNLKKIKFIRTNMQVQNDYNYPGGQKLLRAWETHNSVLGLIPDWRKRFLGNPLDRPGLEFNIGSGITRCFAPLPPERAIDTIYADVLLSAVQAGIKPTHIRIQDQLWISDHNYDWGTRLSGFHSWLRNPSSEWQARYREVFNSLERIDLHLTCEDQELDTMPPVSPVFLPTLENVQEVFLSEKRHRRSCRLRGFMLPENIPLPHLQRLHIHKANLDSFHGLTSFLHTNKSTVKDLILSPSAFTVHALPGRDLLEFLTFVYEQMELEDFLIIMNAKMSPTGSRARSGRIFICADGAWKGDVQPFTAEFPNHGTSISRKRMESRMSWEELVMRMEEMFPLI